MSHPPIARVTASRSYVLLFPLLARLCIPSMIIHPLPDDGSVPIQKMDPPSETQEVPADTASAYDTTWTEVPDTGRADGLNRIMGADGKIYVVLAVVLIIWFGVLALLVRTDRKIDTLERRLDQASSERDRDE